MGFGTTSTLLGKTQKSIYLETEMTAIKDGVSVGAVTDTTYQFEAGEIVVVGSAGLTRAVPTTVQGASQLAVAFCSHIPTLDECAATGKGTILWGPHVARTTKYDTTKTYAEGEKLYVGAAGIFTNDGTLDSSGTPHVGFVSGIEGPWLKYRWQPTVATS